MFEILAEQDESGETIRYICNDQSRSVRPEPEGFSAISRGSSPPVADEHPR